MRNLSSASLDVHKWVIREEHFGASRQRLNIKPVRFTRDVEGLLFQAGRVGIKETDN